jgi:hypothetical protein
VLKVNESYYILGHPGVEALYTELVKRDCQLMYLEE